MAASEGCENGCRRHERRGNSGPDELRTHKRQSHPSCTQSSSHQPKRVAKHLLLRLSYELPFLVMTPISISGGALVQQPRLVYQVAVGVPARPKRLTRPEIFLKVDRVVEEDVAADAEGSNPSVKVNADQPRLEEQESVRCWALLSSGSIV